MQTDVRTDSLYRIVERIQQGELRQAQQELSELLASVTVRDDPLAIKYLVFGAALSRRLSEDSFDEAKNLYLADYDVPQIHLFNLLGRWMEPVTASTAIANSLIADACAGEEVATVIDVGTGTGRQMVALLETLAARPRPLRKLTIVGLEPSASSLELAEANLKDAAAKVPIDVTFVPLHGLVERISATEWRRLLDLGPRPVVNASFALHHIQDVEGSDVRDLVLRRLRALSPAALILAEPDSDHLDPDLVRRFDSAWHHFGTTFKVVDSLAIEQKDKDALKVCFFGREIADILGNSEHQRSERHEDVRSWTRRLRRAGFSPAVDLSVPPGVSTEIIDVRPRDGHFALGFGTEPIVSILLAVPDGAPPELALFESAPESAAPPADRHALDARDYLKVLVAIARADKVVHKAERLFIERQAELFGVDPGPLWADPTPLERVLEEAASLPQRTRLAVLRDAILLACIDGEYSADERAEAASLARSLGVDADRLERLESLIHTYVPETLAAAPSWFWEHWVLGSKQVADARR